MDTSYPTPAWTAVLREQLGAVALRTRREMIVLALLLGATMALGLTMVYFGDGGDFDFAPVVGLPAVVLGFIAPLSVWKGEEPSRRSYLWAMPVDRARHTLARVLGGWAWFMVAVAGYLLWALLLALVTGGEIGQEVMRVVTVSETPAGGALTPADMRTLRWSIPLWQWLTPFAGATIAYLLGSIVALASDRPWRWFAGFLFAAFMVVTLAAEAGEVLWMDHLLEAVVNGPLGIAPAFTGDQSHAQTITTPAGRGMEIWRDLPSFRAWVLAMPFWMLTGAAGVWLAARRHQEGAGE